MWLEDLVSGRVIRLDQPRGPGAASCTLDPDALAEAACLLRRGVTLGCTVIVVPRFGAVEAEGAGMRVEIAEAVLSGAVVIIGVRPSLLSDLEQFLGAPGTVLLPGAASIAGWAAHAAGVVVADAAD
jgi:molybdate transport system ATP-binding protein